MLDRGDTARCVYQRIPERMRMLIQAYVVRGEQAKLRDAVSRGYTVVLCFIGLGSAMTSDDRVAMRVMQGGHDVAAQKVATRYPRSLENLRRAITGLPFVWVYDNSDLSDPFRKVVEFEHGVLAKQYPPLPVWVPVPESRP